ncbi:hypothetical protein NUU61_007968 [Penicillium alfredii]|uniref:Zn(2)-C6 fungal-type domain-containing protein n=1 Tax=Penicillium alfredii TaxID=1506179 RepID=A0A9W9ERL3_9EURO|nr:uncharacterized protein NUU61_007968 [Penicillium alfredii]KAJ5086661.1 hypothetical protein NUU61_007968 [Penicillium alfredii]
MSEPKDPSAPPGETNVPASNAPAVETSQPSAQHEQPAGETNQPPAESSNGPTQTNESQAQTSQPPSAERPSEGTQEFAPAPGATLPAIDPSIPAMDTSQSLMESTLSSFDSALPSVGSSAAPDLSLPAIDTTLPDMDSSLPAIGTDIPTMDESHSFGDEGQIGHSDFHTGSADPAGPGQPGPVNGSAQYQPSNGTYNYAQSHAPAQQAPSQHQFQAQPQQHYQQPQQNLDMYHNPAGFSDNNVQGQPGQVPQAPIGSPLPSSMPPMASMGQYMTGYPSNVQPGMSPNAQMRYQLPGDPSKMMSSRHKKEVKRRTKTGCLTCRKRRIKCDEGHPVCRNCVKSKRECLGYDPVFRPQASAPSAIQPAPNPPPSLVVNPQGPPPPPSTPSYPSAPPGYMPATSQPFAPSLHSESPSTSTDQHEHGATVDPSLGAQNSPTVANMQNTGGARPQGTEPTYKAKNLHMNDLVALRGIAPPPHHHVGTLPPGRLEEIQAVFLATYAPAMDKFLEVRWYSEKALSVLMADSQLMADYSALIDAFNEWNLQDGETVARLESFEASLIWRSMILCRKVPNAENGQHGEDWNLLATWTRLNVIEALLTWNYLDENPLSQAVRMDAANPPNPPDQFMSRQLDFWDSLGEFLTLHDNEASSAKQIDDALSRCRQLLDTYENRDIIYSIAIARHLGQRWADFPNNLPKVGSTNEKEAGTKLFVAQKFLEEEAEGKGTTQIYKRVCCMAVRSWWIARE